MREFNLREKGDVVQALWDSVSGAEGNLASVPGAVRALIATQAWRRREQRGKVYEHDSLLSFITTKPLAGCGWEPDKIEALIRDDAELLMLWRREITAKPGHPSQSNSDNVTIKPKRGNTRAYTLDRLEREWPDLYERVRAGELSANAAAIEAGWRKQPTTLGRVLALLPKLSQEELRRVHAEIWHLTKRM